MYFSDSRSAFRLFNSSQFSTINSGIPKSLKCAIDILFFTIGIVPKYRDSHVLWQSVPLPSGETINLYSDRLVKYLNWSLFSILIKRSLVSRLFFRLTLSILLVVVKPKEILFFFKNSIR